MPPPRPHPLAVSRAAALANRAIGRLWETGLVPRPPLDPEFLWRKGAAGFASADETAGRLPADAADFRERLAALCRSLEQEARLNALGHAMAYGQLTGAIRKRHALGRMWRVNPGLAQTSIAPPIIVVGQMRAGTTRVHRLLAADPAHAGTRFCNAVNPVPPEIDWRPLKSRVGLAIARRINPWLDTLHPFGATRVDEELGWLASALDACAYEAQWRIPGFVALGEARDPAPVYREFARILAADAAHRGNAHLPRVLKVPQFAEDLPALLERFPGARLVVARREPANVARSSASLVANQMAIQSDAVDLAWIEREWERKIALRQARMEAALARFAGPLAEVDFAALEADWRGEVARIYGALGLDLTPGALAAMAAEQARAARSPHRSHRAALEAFAGA